MAKSRHFYIRKTHRYLGLILGIQFLFWTVSGIYFSWSDMDEIHGDYEKKGASLIDPSAEMVSPSSVLKKMNLGVADSVISIQLINLNGKPVYQVRYTRENVSMHHQAPAAEVKLANALTGELRPPLSKEEAISLAKSRFNGQEKVNDVVYLNRADAHHEYRESPLPAYGITFSNSAKTTVYVATELGTVQSFRNNKWRIFDFLWMTHTMDYQSRDNIGNILLRVFSVFGLVTILSGFALYVVSSKRFKKRRWREGRGEMGSSE